MPKRSASSKYLFKLAGRITEKYGTQADFAYALKKSAAFVNFHVCGTTDFRAEEISQWCDLLEIRSDEIKDYFMPQWRPRADSIIPSGKAKARFDTTTGSIFCNAYAGGERR